jgi:transaldolase
MLELSEITKKIKIFCDSATVLDMDEHVNNPMIHGFTSNPTLARSAGIVDYLKFAHSASISCDPKEVSIEVIADDNENMLRQGTLLAEIGKNISVKIPVTNSLGSPTTEVIKSLAANNCYLNVTAVFSVEQSRRVLDALAPAQKSILSIFAGRIADTGRDPVPHVREIVKLRDEIAPNVSVLWASPRELINLLHAYEAGADIITMTPALIAKLKNFGKDLEQYSLETVQMFTNDAIQSGFKL